MASPKASKADDPPGYAEAMDEFRTSDVAREMKEGDKIGLQGMVKYIKNGDCKDEEPSSYADPIGHERWAAHQKWNGQPVLEVKKNFAANWRKLRDDFLSNRKLEVDDRVMVTKSLYKRQGPKKECLEGWKGQVVEIDSKGNALVSIEKPEVERWVLAGHAKKFLKILKMKAQDVEGSYVVDHDKCNCKSSYAKGSKVLGTVPRGKHINVIEVHKESTKLFGRIKEKPGPGWVRLADLHSGKRWAVVPDPEAITGVFRNIVRQDVYGGVEYDSKHLHKLDAGMCVNVADVVYTQDAKAARGRITSPFTGWITLSWSGVEFAEFVPPEEEPDEAAADAAAAKAMEEAEKNLVLLPRDKFKKTEEYVQHVAEKLNAAITEHKQLAKEKRDILRHLEQHAAG